MIVVLQTYFAKLLCFDWNQVHATKLSGQCLEHPVMHLCGKQPVETIH